MFITYIVLVFRKTGIFFWGCVRVTVRVRVRVRVTVRVTVRVGVLPLVALRVH